MTSLIFKGNSIPISSFFSSKVIEEWDPFKEFDSLIRNHQSFTKNYSVASDNDLMTLSVDLPGVKKDNLKVSVDGQRVTIVSKRNEKESTQSYNVDEKYDASTIDALLEDGVLTIKFSRKENAKQRQIEVKTK